MCAGNHKRILKNKKLVDFDAVSLYPSAQKRIYYPKGECRSMNEHEI